MGEPAKEKKDVHPLEGVTDDPAAERLLDLIKAREAIASERGGKQLMPGMSREKHITEMRRRGATEEYIAFIYESIERNHEA